MECTESKDIAEFVYCSECGEEAICINDDILPIGTCVNCGHFNIIEKCDKCGKLFNSDEVGVYEDDIAICSNCLDKLENE